MPASMQDNSVQRERLVELVDYVAHLLRLRSRDPVANLEDYRDLVVHESELTNHEGIRFNRTDGDGPKWVSIQRLPNRPQPPVPEVISEWVSVSDDPFFEPETETSIEQIVSSDIVQQEVNLGLVDPSDVSLSHRLDVEAWEDAWRGEQCSVIYRLENLPEIREAIDDYLVRWRDWSGVEKPRRKTAAIYRKLFDVLRRVDTNDAGTEVEIVFGIGVARSRLGDGKVVNHPVIEQLVELEIEDQTGEITIRPRSSEPRVAVRALSAIDESAAERTNVFAQEAIESYPEDKYLNPFDTSSFVAILRHAATNLRSNARYHPDDLVDGNDRSLPEIDEDLRITDTWVIFARSRSEDFRLEDLARLRNSIEHSASLPLSVEAIVTTPSKAATAPSILTSGDGDSKLPSDIRVFFPKPFNDEQLSIVKRLERAEGVVVQGPPGTGKTHTIANIISHYMATGRRVLVTSHTEAALTVLRDQIPESIRDLTISMLTNERAGLRQMERATQLMAATVANTDISRLEKDINRDELRINDLKDTLSSIDRKLRDWADMQTKPAPVGSNKMLPTELAKRVAEERHKHDWLTDDIGIGSEHNPQFSDDDIAAAREARRILGDNLIYIDAKLPQCSDFPDSDLVARIHRDLALEQDLVDEARQRGIDLGIFDDPHAIERLQQTRENMQRMVEVWDWLADEPWLSDVVDDWLSRGKEPAPVEKTISTARRLLTRQTEIAEQSVELPHGAEKLPELLDVVNDEAQGISLFGKFPYGRDEARDCFDQVRIDGRKPLPNEWQKVEDRLRWLVDFNEFKSLYNRLADEFSVPELVGDTSRISDWLERIRTSLLPDIDVITSNRRDIIENDVELPPGAFRDAEFRAAVTRGAELGKPFGWWPLGRSELKAKVGEIRFNGRIPKNKHDWSKIRQACEWLVDAMAVGARWNAVARDFSIPEFQTSDPEQFGLWFSRLSMELGPDTVRLCKMRESFAASRIWLPPDAEMCDEFLNSVEMAAAGQSPFGNLPFGKDEIRRVFAGIRVNGREPLDRDDWKQVAETLEWRSSVLELAGFWNSLAIPYAMPHLEHEVEEIVQNLVKLSDVVDVMRRDVSHLRRNEQELSKIDIAISSALRSAKSARDAVATLNHAVRIGNTKKRIESSKAKVDSRLVPDPECSGPIVDEIRAFATGALGSPDLSHSEASQKWSELRANLADIRSQRPQMTILRRVTQQILRSGAPIWASRLVTEPAKGGDDPWIHLDWQDAWEHRRYESYLKQMKEGDPVEKLAEERAEHEVDLRKTRERLVGARASLSLKKSMSPEVESSLAQFTNAIRRIGKGTGIRARRYRRDARVAMESSYSAVPCWIMPSWRVSESLPAELGSFDLVIVDEASQSDICILPALLRAKKVLVVGDDKQVSPTSFVREEDVLSLRRRFLTNQPFASDLVPESSLYDLALTMYPGGRTMLREHFRCVEPIIRFSMQFYEEPLDPLRIPKISEKLDPPLIDIYVPHGNYIRGINQAEVDAIVDEIECITSDAKYRERTIGVVSLVGFQQTRRIQQLLIERIGEMKFAQHDIVCGDARTFQGKERDIMFVSMVVSPCRATARTTRDAEQRFNVALSRARDRVYLFRSVRENDLKNQNDLNRKVIAHFKSPMPDGHHGIDDLLERCESEFERDVFKRLNALGYRVTPQVGVGNYRIDLVVDGERDRRLAIELDGDQYHGPDRWEHDIARQRQLERMGWTFWRCWGSSYYLDPETSIEDLVAKLYSMGIEPLGNSTYCNVYTEHRVIECPMTEESQPN